jgi:hypothetical protein
VLWQYEFPSTWGTTNDNVVANGQILALETPTYVHELHMVYSGDASGSASHKLTRCTLAHGYPSTGAHEFVANFVLNFADNSTQQLQCTSPIPCFCSTWVLKRNSHSIC